MDQSNVALTENLDKAYSTSGSKCLDFFTRITRSATISDYVTAFFAAWVEDKETACKILLNLRDIRNGKGEKMIPCVLFVVLKLSLDETTYTDMLKELIKIGCWKDLLRILDIYTRYSTPLRMNKRRQTYLVPTEIRLYTDQLRTDINILNQTNTPTNAATNTPIHLATNTPIHPAISLCGKWAPSEHTHYDHHPLHFAQKIASGMNLSAKDYRQTLSRLREHLHILERYMSTQRFNEIDFSHIPAAAMMKMNRAFNRDTNAANTESEPRRLLHLSYAAYLANLSKGQTKVNIKGIQPHELVRTYLSTANSDITNQTELIELNELVEAQWDTLKAAVKKTGSFDNVIAVVDVSSSMNGQPMLVSIALGILVAELTQGIWGGKMITFSEEPEWHVLTGSSLKEKVACLTKMKWGTSTNMRSVFTMILNDAVTHSLSADQMIKTLFIFTDMQFNCSTTNSGSAMATSAAGCSETEWMSTFEWAKSLYTAAGYRLPDIICWNLRTSDTKTLPFTRSDQGFATLSGFSSELFSYVLLNQELTPCSLMNHVLAQYNVPASIKQCQTDLTFVKMEQLASAVEKATIKRAYKQTNRIDSILLTTDSTDSNIDPVLLEPLLTDPMLSDSLTDMEMSVL